jgi:hypothetical protein
MFRQAVSDGVRNCAIRQVQLENELRQGLANIGDYLRATIDAARTHVSTAAGGAVAAQKSPLACRHLSMLARYRNPLPASETIRLHLALLEAAWQAIDAALASLCEIRFGGALGVDIQKWYSNPSSSPWLVTS